MITKTKPKEGRHGTNGAGQKPPRIAPRPPDEDPFRYGWRTITETQPDGTVVTYDVPLPLSAFLDPQWGDHFVQSDPHLVCVVSVYNRFKKRFRQAPTTGVFSDLKMEWGIPGLKEPVPDLAIAFNLKNSEAKRSTFDVQAEGVRPSLIVEVVSPLYPGDDTDKVAIYEQAGIAEYIVINPHFDKANEPITLQGWRLVEGKYVKMIPDAQGRLFSQSTGVWFALDASKKQLILIDDATGAVLRTEEQEEAAREQAEIRAEQAKAQAEQAKAQAEQAKASAIAEREARLAAEAQAAALVAEIARLQALWAQQGSTAQE